MRGGITAHNLFERIEMEIVYLIGIAVIILFWFIAAAGDLFL